MTLFTITQRKQCGNMHTAKENSVEILKWLLICSQALRVFVRKVRKWRLIGQSLWNMNLSKLCTACINLNISPQGWDISLEKYSKYNSFKIVLCFYKLSLNISPQGRDRRCCTGLSHKDRSRPGQLENWVLEVSSCLFSWPLTVFLHGLWSPFLSFYGL